MSKERERKIFLEGLCKNKEGIIDLNLNLGNSIKFIWDGTEGFIRIITYNKSNDEIIIEYSGNKYGVKFEEIKNCKLGKLIGGRATCFKYDINQSFKDERRDIIITDMERRLNSNGTNQKWYKYTCNKCGWTEGWTVEKNLQQGCGCSVCGKRPKAAVLGINTIWDTDRWMVDLGVSEEDAKKFTRCSTKKVKVICPYCGQEKMRNANYIYNSKSIACVCVDGHSYPEKFMTSILNQLSINFQTQLSCKYFSWCGDKRYDFYIPSLNMIIEVHGEQHYEESRDFQMSLKEVQENDRLKKELALANGITYYIELDCRKSNLKYIKNNILNSELSYLLNLSNIDWLKCEEFALGNLTKEVCEYWNNSGGKETPKSLASKFNISRYAASIYLQQGEKYGWCKYAFKRKVKVEVFLNNTSLRIFDSIKELAVKSEEVLGVKLSESVIGRRINNEEQLGKPYKGYILKRVVE